MIVTLKPANLAPTLRKFAEENRAAVARGILSAAQRGRGYLQQQTPVDQGIMRAAWDVRPAIGALGTVRIENSAPYAGVIERGARPHAVSAEGVDAIRQWVIRKGLVKHTVKRGARAGQLRPVTRKQAEGAYAREVDAVVWAIVNKIRTEGARGRFIVAGSLEKLRDFLDAEVRREMAAAPGKVGQ